MPPTQISCLGLSHHTAPVELRERLHCSPADLSQRPALPTGHSGRIREVTILSTCNRVELYACVDATGPVARNLLVSLLAQMHGMEPESFARHLYYYNGREAVSHLLRVATGLDSLVLGETQILGQVTGAYMSAVETKVSGPVLTALFRAAIRTGKRARAETNISTNPASISSAAVSLAQKCLGDLSERNCLVVGLGEMGQLALKGLRARGLSRVAVANRSRSRAEAAVTPWRGQAYTLDELPQALAAADLVISATGAPHVMVERAAVVAAMAGRDRRDLVLIDLAVPRDVDPAVRRLPGVYLFDLDELQGYLDDSLVARRQEIPRVEAIIGQEIDAFETELNELALRPLIVDLRQKAEAIRRHELQRTLRHLGDVDEQTLTHIQHLSRSLVNKLLHEPTLRLKKSAGDDEAAGYAAAVRDLFGLSEGDES